jgi:hypothetical protein
MFHMKNKFSEPEFFRMINGKPLVCSLLEVYAKQQDIHLLRNFYYQDDRRISSANLIFSSSYKESDLDSRFVELKACWKLYCEQKISINESRGVEDFIKLLQIHLRLERDLGISFTDLTLIESILKCFNLTQPVRANKFKTEFKINDKKYLLVNRFSMLEYRGLVETQNWDLMEVFVRAHQKFSYRFGLDLLFSKGYHTQSYKFVDAYNPGTIVQREARAYQEEWLNSLRGRSLNKSGPLSVERLSTTSSMK